MIRKILSNYNIKDIQNIKPLKTSGNISYLIKTKTKKYFLRLSPDGPRARTKNDILAEIELLKFLHKKDIPVLLPIVQKNGKEIVSYKKHNGYLREFLIEDARLDTTIQEVKAVGRLLGKMHKILKNYKTKYSRSHNFGLEETEKLFLKNKNKILKSNFRNKDKFVTKFIEEINALKFSNKLPKGAIHEDLGKRHILWSKKNIKTVIDFDRFYFGDLILDLGQALRGWCFDKDWQKWDIKKHNAFLSAYQAERKLTLEEKKYLINAIKFAFLERALSFCLSYIYLQKKRDEVLANDELFNLLPQIDNLYKIF